MSVLANQGRIIQAFQHRRLREGRSGSSCRISEPVNFGMLAACQAICEKTRLTGVCMFEFRYNPVMAAWVLLEVNARFWGSLPLPLSLGVDFPQFLYELMVRNTEVPQVNYSAGIMARNFALDGRNLLADTPQLRAPEFRRWLSDIADFLTQPMRWLAGTERSDTFVKDDLAPAFLECIRLVGSGTTRLSPRLPVLSKKSLSFRRSFH